MLWSIGSNPRSRCPDLLSNASPRLASPEKTLRELRETLREESEEIEEWGKREEKNEGREREREKAAVNGEGSHEREDETRRGHR